MGDGEVIKERFVRPFPGRVWWRAKAGRCGRKAQVIEDLPDDRWALNHGDHLHRAPATRTEQRIDLVDLTNQARPRSADLIMWDV